MTNDLADLEDVLTGDVAEWVAVLPSYQRDLINNMLVDRDPTTVAVAWLSSSGPADTAPLGAARAGATLFYDNLLKQIQLLLCGGTDFEEERTRLLSDARAGRAMLVTGIATAVAPIVGAAAVVIAPAVALVLAVVARAGADAACETLSRMITQREAAGDAGEAP